MRNLDEEDEYAPPMTPLIDIVFLLIIFFLVSTTFLEEERDIQIVLPQAAIGEARVAVTQPVTLNIRKNGQILWGSEALTPEQLETRLRAWLKADERNANVPVVLRGHKLSLYQDNVSVIEICHRAGVRKVSFAVAQRSRVLLEALD